MFSFMKKVANKTKTGSMIENIFLECGFNMSPALQKLAAKVTAHGYDQGETIIQDKTISPAKDYIIAGFCLAKTFLNRESLELREDQLLAVKAGLFKLSSWIEQGLAHDEIILNETDKVLKKTIDSAFAQATK